VDAPGGASPCNNAMRMGSRKTQAGTPVPPREGERVNPSPSYPSPTRGEGGGRGGARRTRKGVHTHLNIRKQLFQFHEFIVFKTDIASGNVSSYDIAFSNR
jgi:hypothetical protein